MFVFPSVESRGQQHRLGTRSALGKEVFQEQLKGGGVRGGSRECFSGGGMQEEVVMGQILVPLRLGGPQPSTELTASQMP